MCLILIYWIVGRPEGRGVILIACESDKDNLQYSAKRHSWWWSIMLMLTQMPLINYWVLYISTTTPTSLLIISISQMEFLKLDLYHSGLYILYKTTIIDRKCLRSFLPYILASSWGTFLQENEGKFSSTVPTLSKDILNQNLAWPGLASTFYIKYKIWELYIVEEAKR